MLSPNLQRVKYSCSSGGSWAAWILKWLYSKKGHAKEEQLWSVILFLIYLSIVSDKNRAQTQWLLGSRQCDCTSSHIYLVKLNQKQNVWLISTVQLSEWLELFICLWALFSFCPIFCFPSRADWIILSRGSRICVGSLRRICSPRRDGLKERICVCVRERKNEREWGRVSERADGWVTQCSNIPGQ